MIIAIIITPDLEASSLSTVQAKIIPSSSGLTANKFMRINNITVPSRYGEQVPPDRFLSCCGSSGYKIALYHSSAGRLVNASISSNGRCWQFVSENKSGVPDIAGS